ncbi:hypothetical protein C8Q77DRAFT_1157842 [Trametes polyzona]|nr:hypothetical protein C8Q77DRAFT_1157842 [Trametes polyzona]
MAPTAYETSPTSDNSLILPPVFQVSVIFSIVSLVLRYFGSRLSSTGIAQPQATFPVDVELQAYAPGSVFVRRSRFWWFSSLFRQLRDTSRDAWLDFTAALLVLGRGGSIESLPLPVSSRRASSFSVSRLFRKLFGRSRRLMGRISSVVVVRIQVSQLELLSYQAVWAPVVVVSPVADANLKFAPAETSNQTRPCLQTSTTPPSPTLFDYTFPRDPSGVTPAGVG